MRESVTAPWSVMPLSVCTSAISADDCILSTCDSPSWYGDPQPVAIRVGFVQCEYCATSQKRPDNGKCCACGGPTPHTQEAV